MARGIAAGAALMVVTAVAGCGDGSTGSSAPAARDVAVRATDALRFEPASVTARAGERVTFVVSNTGTVDHEFVIGTAAYLAEHADRAAESPSAAHAGHGGDGGAAVEVPAGRTARVTVTMPGEAPSFACFVARHDRAGMTGTVSYA